MIVSEYIAECNATVREKLEELYEKHGRDDSLAYAAYRWGFALVDAQIPETGYIELLGKASDSFIKAKAEMDDVVDELIDTYGDGFVEDAVKDEWGMMPGNPNMVKQVQSYDGSDKAAERSPEILYNLENLGTEYGQELRERVLENASDEAKAFFNNLDYDPVRLLDSSLVSSKMWHEMRHYSIGASDLSSLTGNSPYNNALGLWHSKLRHPITGKSEKEEKALIFEWGHNAEAFLRKALMSRPEFGGCRVLVDPMVFGSAQMPCMTCNLDAVLAWPDGHYSLLEFKAPTPYKKGEYEDDAIPANYYDQVQGQMMLLNVDDAYLVALFDRDTITVSHVFRDLDYEMSLAKISMEFWADVESDTPPAINGSGDVIIEIMNRYGAPANAKAPAFKLDEERFAQLLDEASYYSEQQKALTREAEKAKDAYTDVIARVIAEMGSNVQAYCVDTFNNCVYRCKYTEVAETPTMNKASLLQLKNENHDLYDSIAPYITYRGGGRRFTLRKEQKE